MTQMAYKNGDRVEQLIGLTRELRRLIDQETHALTERRPMSLKETEEEKARLARLYWTEISILRKDQSLTADAPIDLRERLTLETKAFNDSLQMHAQTVNAAKTVSERMVHAIAKGAEQINRQGNGYGKNAAFASAPRTRAYAMNRVA